LFDTLPRYATYFRYTLEKVTLFNSRVMLRYCDKTSQ
jgi:hypothetical protein